MGKHEDEMQPIEEKKVSLEFSSCEVDDLAEHPVENIQSAKNKLGSR